MRILIVTTVNDMMRDFLLPFARHFHLKGWQVDALARRDETHDECAAAFDRIYDTEWSRNPLALRAFLRTADAVRELVEREKYEIVHVHTPIAGFIARFALRNLQRTGKVKVIYTAHGFHFYKGGSSLKNVIYLGLEKAVGRWTDFLVVINREDEEAARRYRIVPPERLRYMPGIGMDLTYFNPETVPADEVARVRAELHLAPNETLFLMIAEFTSNKNHRHAVQALATGGRADVHLAFAGRGEQMEETRRLATELGVGARVHFLGYRRDIPSLIRAARATLLISAREGLPRSVMEALNLGSPVIGTDIRGIRDLLAGGGGLLVPVGDVDGLSRAITWMADHPDEAAAMGILGRRDTACYDLRHLIALHESLYTEAHEQMHTPPIKRSHGVKGAANQCRFKRALDCTVAFVVLALCSPILMVLSLVLAVRLGRPVLFAQHRPGINGKPFTMYKFRTMSEARDATGNLLPDEQRLTPLGAFLRATSLDELPTLINVLKGEMSLVGPRPLLMGYLDIYSPEQARRLDVLPGITGWAQVHGRNAISYERTFELDVWYVEHQSPLIDLRILAMTAAKILRREGSVARKELWELDAERRGSMPAGVGARDTTIEMQSRSDRRERVAM